MHRPTTLRDAYRQGLLDGTSDGPKTMEVLDERLEALFPVRPDEGVSPVGAVTSLDFEESVVDGANEPDGMEAGPEQEAFGLWLNEIQAIVDHFDGRTERVVTAEAVRTIVERAARERDLAPGVVDRVAEYLLNAAHEYPNEPRKRLLDYSAEYVEELRAKAREALIG